MDWILKTFRRYTSSTITKQASQAPLYQINSIIISSVECLKIFVVKILRIEKSEENLKFSPLKINLLYGIKKYNTASCLVNPLNYIACKYLLSC